MAASKKRATSYRLTDEAREMIAALAGAWGVSEAAVVDTAVRQLTRWVRESAPPGGLGEDRAAAVAGLQASELPRGRKPRQTRPRKGE